MVTGISKFDWNPDLETGIDIVDEQHRRYFQLLNNYLEKISATLSDSNQFFDLLEKFDFLHQYAKEHFSTEELIMQEADEHLYFERHVEELYERLKAEGFSQELASEADYYMIEWFVKHIREADMDLAEFLHNKVSLDKKISGLLKKLYASLFKSN
jgi:hemerythrin